MTPHTNPTPNLQQLSTDLDRAVRRAKIATIFVVVLSVASLGVAGFILSSVHHRAVSELTPEHITKAVVGEFQFRRAEITADLKDRIIQQAPAILDNAEAQLLEIPDRFGDSLLARTEAELDRLLPQLEDELHLSLRTALQEAVAARPPGQSDEQQVRELLALLAESYETESLRLIEDLRSRYTRTGGDVLGYLEFLADAQGLDRRQQLERQALVTFLTIAHRAGSFQWTATH